MSTRTLGVCSICGGRVAVYEGPWMGAVPPLPMCEWCGAVPACPTGPIIQMERPVVVEVTRTFIASEEGGTTILYTH